MATIAEQLTSLANTKTAIKQAIIDKGVSIADDTPFSGYATKIGEIQGGSSTKFGASVDTFIGDVVDGVLNAPTAQTALNFAGVTEIGERALYYRFYENNTITSVDFGSVQIVGNNSFTYAFAYCPDLTSVDFGSLTTVGTNAFNRAFFNCKGLKNLDLSSLQIVGNNGFASAFNYCSGITGVLDLSSLQTVGESGFDSCFGGLTTNKLTSVILSSLQSVGKRGFNYAFSGCKNITGALDISSLTTIGEAGFYGIFNQCAGITSVDLSSLQSIGARGMQSAFSSCKGLTTLSFPALTDVQVDSFCALTSSGISNVAFYGCTNLTEIHFRADMQATIEALNGYDSKWGATSSTIYFDL